MLLGIGFKVVLLSSLLLGVMVPARARILAGRAAGSDLAAGPFSRHPAVGLIGPLARVLDHLVRDATTRAGSARRWAAAVVFVAPLSAFAVVPFGSRYRLGEWEIGLVIADLDWGILWLLGCALLSVYGSIGLQRGTAERVRYAIVASSYAAAAGLALVAVAMVFGSLEPLAIAVAQDHSLSLSFGDSFAAAFPSLARLPLPAWGLFLQPVSALLFVVCTLAMPRLSPLGPLGEPEAGRSGAEDLLVRASEHLGSLLFASVVCTLFLGGGSIPFVSGETITTAIGAYYGAGFATLVCMVIQVSVFFAKLMLVTIAAEPLRARLSGLSFEVSLGWCWKVAIPFAVLNLFVTAQVLVEGGTPR